MISTRRFGHAAKSAFAFSVPLVLAIAVAGTQAQVPSTTAIGATQGPYRISGTVVNSTSGEPISRATVAVLTEEDSHAVESALTDTEGRFTLTGLAARKYQLSASKRGFRTAFYDEHDAYSTAIVTGEGLDTSGFTFRMTPDAVLRGVVTGDGGDPVEGARVLLFARPGAHRPNERVSQMDAASTDDTGAYEFSNLPAGEYVLAVTAEPWYSLHRTSSQTPIQISGRTPDQNSNESARQPVADGSNPLDVAYPVTYFDSTNDESSATPIVLAGGASEVANINLHAVPALHLFVQASRQQDGSIARPELRQSIFGAQISAESMGLFDGSGPRTVEFTGVAPGHYELSQGDPPRIVELDATASQQVDPTIGTPTVEVSGTLKSASGAPLPGEINVVLQSAIDEHRRDPVVTNAPRGSFHFASVPPGKWTVTAQATGNQLPVIALNVGSHTHAGNLLTVADRPVQLTLIVSQGQMRIDGFARKEGKGFAGAMVVLVPKNLAGTREPVPARSIRLRRQLFPARCCAGPIHDSRDRERLGPGLAAPGGDLPLPSPRYDRHSK